MSIKRWGLQNVIKYTPQVIKKWGRSNLWLSSRYTAALCKTGLHPSVDVTFSKARQYALSDLPCCPIYEANRMSQQQQIDDVLISYSPERVRRNIDVIIDYSALTCWDEEIVHLLECSLTSVVEQSFQPSMLVLLIDEANEQLLQQKIDTVSNVLLSNYKIVNTYEDAQRYVENAVLFINCLDVLHKDCLAILSISHQASDFIYVDTDSLGNDAYFNPKFLPDWNPDLQLSSGYITTGVLCNDYSLVMSIISECRENPVIQTKRTFIANVMSVYYLCNLSMGKKDNVAHIPHTLVHSIDVYYSRYETIDENVATLPPIDTSKLFINTSTPLVSLIIPTYNGKELVQACVESILEKSTYKHFEILLIDNNSNDQAAIDYFAELNEHPKITVLSFPFPFNYSAINNFGVKHASGEVIGLINNDIEVINEDWLDKMVSHVVREDIACVGAKLLYSNGLVQHAGVIMGYGGGAGHAHKYFPAQHPGYMQRAIATQNFSAVTAACLLVTKQDFLSVDGLNEQDLTVAFNDVDFCLRLLEKGKRNLLCAEALMYHHESVSRGHEDTVEKQLRFRSEVKYLKSTWSTYIEHDPAYNPNLTLKSENFTMK